MCKIRWKGVKTVVNESNYCNCAAVQIQLVLIDTDSDWDGNLKCPQSIEDSSFLHSLAVHCHRSRQSLPRKVAAGRALLEEQLAPHLIARTRRKGRWTRTRTRRKGRWMGKWGKGRQGSTEQRQPWPWWRTILNTTRGTCLCLKTEVSCSGKDWRREAFRMTPQSLDWEVPNLQPCANVPDQSVACCKQNMDKLLMCDIHFYCWFLVSEHVSLSRQVSNGITMWWTFPGKDSDKGWEDARGECYNFVSHIYHIYITALWKVKNICRRLSLTQILWSVLINIACMVSTDNPARCQPIEISLPLHSWEARCPRSSQSPRGSAAAPPALEGSCALHRIDSRYRAPPFVNQQCRWESPTGGPSTGCPSPSTPPSSSSLASDRRRRLLAGGTWGGQQGRGRCKVPLDSSRLQLPIQARFCVCCSQPIRKNWRRLQCFVGSGHTLTISWSQCHPVQTFRIWTSDIDTANPSLQLNWIWTFCYSCLVLQ